MISVSDDQRSEQLLKNISKGTETALKSIEENSQTSEQPESKNVLESIVRTSDQLIKKKIVETSHKIVNKTIINTSNPPIKTMSVSTEKTLNKPITEMIVKISNQPIQENIVESSGQTHEKKLIETSDQSINKNITAPPVFKPLINASIPITPTKSDVLNYKNITIPKSAISNVNAKNQLKINLPGVSTSSLVVIQPKVNNTENKLSEPTQKVNIVSSSESKPGIVYIKKDGMNYVIKKISKDGFNNESSLKSNSIMTSIRKPVNSVETSKVFKGYDVKKSTKLVNMIDKLPTNTFKVVPGTHELPEYLKTLIKNDLVQKVSLNSNQQRVDNMMIKSDNPAVKYNNTKRLEIIPTLSKIHPVKKDIKLIPHTVTSKDLIEDKAKTNTNEKRESPKYILPKTELLSKLESKPFNFVKSDKSPSNDDNNSKLCSVKSIDKSNVECVFKNNCDATDMNEKLLKDASVEVLKPEDKSSDKGMESTSNTIIAGNIKNKRKVLLEGIHSKSNKLVSCQNKFCDAMVFEPDLIFKMYCSMECHNKTRLLNTTVAYIPQKPKVDRKLVLQKLKNRIRERRKRALAQTQLINVTDSNSIDEFEPSNNDISASSEIENLPRNKKIIAANNNLNSTEVLKNTSNQQNVNQEESISNQKLQLPKIPQLANEAYLKSIEEGKQILNYVQIKNFNSASKKLFDKPFPRDSNEFRVDQRLIAIDPEHESLFCVMTIVEIRGYRLKLHFDGYSDDYDYWVNADCPDIFHIKWCAANDRPLQPPFNYGKPFNWSTYLKECKAAPAPKSNFASTVSTTYFKNHKFEVGAKLEALDKVTRTLAKQLICVATVADVMGGRIRVHFDGWTDDFDYWTSITSTNLHPIGWCDYNGRTLVPPCGYNDSKGRKPFSWKEYLKETNSTAVPEDAFYRSPIREFEIGTSIEVVDLVVPSLIRVAKIIDVKGNEIKILYDGFHPNYGYWIEDDNPDIHPIGWCFKTHHPLEIPPEVSIWSCKVSGCNGKGNLNKKKIDHINAKDCPYEMDSWKKAVNGLLRIPDRLNPCEMKTSSISRKNSKSRGKDFQEKGKQSNQISSAITKPDVIVESKEETICEKSNKELNTKELNTEELNPKESNNTSNINKNGFEGFRITKTEALSNPDFEWTKHRIFANLPIYSSDDPRKWSVYKVAEYAELAVKNKCIENPYFVSDRFIEQEIDGESFLMLTKNDLLKTLQLPLGPAIKIYHAIKFLKERAVIFNNINTNFLELKKKKQV